MFRHLFFIALTLANWGFAKGGTVGHSTASRGLSGSGGGFGAIVFSKCMRGSEYSLSLSCTVTDNSVPVIYKCNGDFAGRVFSNVQVNNGTLVDDQKRSLPCGDPSQSTPNYSPFSNSSPTRTLEGRIGF